MYRLFFIIFIFIVGLYFYSVDNIEGFGTRNCPNLLLQKGSKIYLKNTSLAEVPGVNPVVFNNLEEYTEFVEWQKSQGINCNVLYLKHEYDTQGNGVYKIRPDTVETSGGSQAMPPGNIGSLDTVNIPTYTPEVHDSISQGYDPDNQEIGVYTSTDALYNIGQTQETSANAMDPNWGGEEYSRQYVDNN